MKPEIFGIYINYKTKKRLKILGSALFLVTRQLAVKLWPAHKKENDIEIKTVDGEQKAMGKPFTDIIDMGEPISKIAYNLIDLRLFFDNHSSQIHEIQLLILVSLSIIV